MLRFAEEILLLALDEETGRLHDLPKHSLELALAGAFLFELSFQKRLDNDLSSLRVVDWSATGDPLLDKVVKTLRSAHDSLGLRQALDKVSHLTADMVEPLFKSLEEKGILEHREKRFLWKVKEIVHPVKDPQPELDVRRRIRAVILMNQVPSPRDVVIISLMETCKLHRILFTPSELEECRERIRQMGKLEALGAAMISCVHKSPNAEPPPAPAAPKPEDAPAKK